MNNLRKIIFTFAAILALYGCANMGQPDGGWFDETPPHVVTCIPADQSTGVNAQKITIYFDEYIKLDNPSEKVVVSPPQLETPEIKGAGNRIIVELSDSLKPNTTYTIDFSDAISDNNEGNPLGNYTYSFSTGQEIDTLQVAGYVLEAENLEPIKGILVGLYANLADSAFTTEPMLRVSRTDSRGRFNIKGVAPGEYRIYALQDADNNYQFSQQSEKLAFSHDIIIPSSKPDVRQDTIWRDSLHIDDITRVGYTHFLPDDIVLRAFTEIQTSRFLLKQERSIPEQMTFFFTYGNPQLPEIHGVNFDETDALLLETNALQDTLTYWLRDTTLVNRDTLNITYSYLYTDTLGVLQSKTDTLEILSKIPYAKRLKDQEKEREKWEKEQEKAKKRGKSYLEEMPPKPLDISVLMPQDMYPDAYVNFNFATPIAIADTSKIRLSARNDTIWEPRPFLLEDRPTYMGIPNCQAIRSYRLSHASEDGLWEMNTEYRLELDSAAFVDIYGHASLATGKIMRVKADNDYTTITFNVITTDTIPYVGQLLDKSEKVIRQAVAFDGVLRFEYVKPGQYYLRLCADANGNGQWDTGRYDDDLQAEMVYYYPELIECKAKWPLQLSWNPTSVFLARQKPTAITKQKPDKEKKIKNQNAERARKLGILYVPNNRY